MSLLPQCRPALKVVSRVGLNREYCTGLVDMGSWVCCEGGYTNELSEDCKYCEHECCINCESVENEDYDDFWDLIIIEEPNNIP